MKNAILGFGLALSLIVAAVALQPAPAEAGPVWLQTLSSTDAGSAATVKLQPQITYCVQAAWSETCIKFGLYDGGTGADGVHGLSADCTKDFIIPQESSVATPREYPYYCFDSAGRSSFTVGNLDAGPATTNLYQLEKNKGAGNGPTTGGK